MEKSHKVGTITLGGMLITFGILFLLRIFVDTISYQFIFHLWPIVFIFLGIEILLANFRQKETKLVYDTTAIVLIVILSVFAMGMAAVDYCMDVTNAHLSIRY